MMLILLSNGYKDYNKPGLNLHTIVHPKFIIHYIVGAYNILTKAITPSPHTGGIGGVTGPRPGLGGLNPNGNVAQTSPPP